MARPSLDLIPFEGFVFLKTRGPFVGALAMSDDSDLDDLLDGATPGLPVSSFHVPCVPPGGLLALRDRVSEKSSLFCSGTHLAHPPREAGLTQSFLGGAFEIGFRVLFPTLGTRRCVVGRAVVRVSTDNPYLDPAYRSSHL